MCIRDSSSPCKKSEFRGTQTDVLYYKLEISLFLVSLIYYFYFQLPSKLEKDTASGISRSILFGQCLHRYHSSRYENHYVTVFML